MARNPVDLPPAPEDLVRNMLIRLEEQAAAGNWSEVEELTSRLRGALLDVPEASRRTLVVEVQHITEEVTRIAMDAREEVTSRISTLRRGQAATRAYELR